MDICYLLTFSFDVEYLILKNLNFTDFKLLFVINKDLNCFITSDKVAKTLNHIHYENNLVINNFFEKPTKIQDFKFITLYDEIILKFSQICEKKSQNSFWRTIVHGNENQKVPVGINKSGISY